MKARFTDEQIIAMIKEQEAGEKTADVCRRHGISSATFYKYKSKYGGMEPSDAKRFRVLRLSSCERSTKAACPSINLNVVGTTLGSKCEIQRVR